jgi:arabinose-5-phosphate isomerase
MRSPDTPRQSGLSVGQDTLRTERVGLDALIAALEGPLGPPFEAAVETVLGLSGHVVITGIGKSGHIGAKIAATLASTGQPSFFLHPSEASHGDLGMLTRECGLLAISNSGESREMRDVLVFARREGVPIIAITRDPQSTLGRAADVVLQLPDAPEACPNGLAPTTSTTLTLALGDALAMAVMARRGFGREDFGLRHPGGKLGLRLQRVSDYLSGQPPVPLPLVAEVLDARSLLWAVSEGRRGCVGVVDAEGRLVGMVTDGDLRRALDERFFDKTASEVMTRAPLTLRTDMRMSEVIEIFSSRRISNAFVVAEGGAPVGIIDFKDLAAQGYL